MYIHTYTYTYVCTYLRTPYIRTHRCTNTSCTRHNGLSNTLQPLQSTTAVHTDNATHDSVEACSWVIIQEAGDCWGHTGLKVLYRTFWPDGLWHLWHNVTCLCQPLSLSLFTVLHRLGKEQVLQMLPTQEQAHHQWRQDLIGSQSFTASFPYYCGWSPSDTGDSLHCRFPTLLRSLSPHDMSVLLSRY